MSLVDRKLPMLSSDLVISPVDSAGAKVVKNRRKKTYLRVGPQEFFLLEQLNGQNSYSDAAAAFNRQFGESISVEDVADFVKMAEAEGLLSAPALEGSHEPFSFSSLWIRIKKAARKQSPIYFKVKLLDPDRLLSRLEPRTRWLFGIPLFVSAVFAALVAGGIAWLHRHDLVDAIVANFNIRSLFVLWITAIGVTVLHELGHGLACKRFGGEVREMGALWVFFTPCLYCDVSDTWLVPSRWKRLLVSLAGTYVDFLIWIAAVMIWRLANPGTMLNYISWIVITSCGIRVAFNVNPLMRLDGYYALSDLLGQPNLRERSQVLLMKYVRSILWGGPWPSPVPSGALLISYGLASFLFSVGILGLLCFGISTWLGQFLGPLALLPATMFFIYLTKSFFKGCLGEDFANMVKKRRVRMIVGLAVLAVVLLIPIPNRVGGEFLVKPILHSEVRAPAAGFLKSVHFSEGQLVQANDLLAQIEIPDLANLIVRKQAEIEEVEAELKRLKIGSRAEVVAEQRDKVTRTETWKELAAANLERARLTMQEELNTLDLKIEQAKTELEFHKATYEQANKLFQEGGLANQQLLSLKRSLDDAQSGLQIAESQKRTRMSAGVVEFEAELAERVKELADTQADLRLLEAGSRPEDIEAQAAKLRRLQEEMNAFRIQEKKQLITAPSQGTVITPRSEDKIGRYCERGDVIFTIEDLQKLEAEIAIPEHFVQSIKPGQKVTLKPRIMPGHTIAGNVERIAPAVVTDERKSSTAVMVYCRFTNSEKILRSGMTGYGRVELGRKTVAGWLYDRFLRLLRTEFWW